MKRAIVAAALLCWAGAAPAHAETMTPPGTWMKAIKISLKTRLSGGEKAKFSRMFYDPQSLAMGAAIPVCGKVTSQESGEEVRKTRFFYALVTLPNGFNHPVIDGVRIGRSQSETGEIWQTCFKLGLI